MKITNVKIGIRLGLAFGLVLILMIALAAIGVTGMARNEKSLDGIVNDNNIKIRAATEMRQLVMSIGQSMRNMALTKDNDEMETNGEHIADDRDEYNSYVETLQGIVTTADGKAILAKIASARAATEPLTDKVVALLHEGKQSDAITTVVNDVLPAQRKWIGTLDEMVRLQENRAEAAVKAAHGTYQMALVLNLAITGVAVALGILAAWFVTRSITVPLRAAVGVARRVADGDLTGDVLVSSSDETGQLMQVLKDMHSNLAHIVARVRSGTDQIASASHEIAEGNMDLSTRTEQQASSLEETASSMEELMATVKQNAEHARQANSMARSASEVAFKGGNVVSQVVDTMGSINASAKKIADIISVIDGIAFQTNILALNAAVEAARAGEQGRGFAVVASEVRNLAQRSAGAAKEIKMLIEDSVEKVNTGTRLVDQAGATMEEVVTSVKRVTDIMDGITAASDEQTSGIEQINEAIIQMDQVTQQNAALVEQAASAAEALQDQAGHLAHAVNEFKLDGWQTAAADKVMAPKAKTLAVPQAKGKMKTVANAGRIPVLSQTGTGDDWEQF